MKIMILTGGNSSERSISLRSAENVKKNLRKNGHKVFIFDLIKGYEQIIKLSEGYDILFPVLHGEEGEGGKLHKFLTKINRPIVGTRDYKGLRKGWYKIPFKKFATKSHLPTSPWKEIKNSEGIIKFGFPCVLKASHGGSSKEVFILNSVSDFNSKDVKKILNSGYKLYVEKYLKGKEMTVGVLNDSPLPVIEIIPPNGEWFSYENKYANTKEIPFAPGVPKDKQRLAQDIALKIHQNFNFGTYSRTDFIYSKGTPYVLETNTIPGLTSESLMPKAALAAGIGFSEFLEILILNAK